MAWNQSLLSGNIFKVVVSDKMHFAMFDSCKWHVFLAQAHSRDVGCVGRIVTSQGLFFFPKAHDARFFFLFFFFFFFFLLVLTQSSESLRRNLAQLLWSRLFPPHVCPVHSKGTWSVNIHLVAPSAFQTRSAEFWSTDSHYNTVFLYFFGCAVLKYITGADW